MQSNFQFSIKNLLILLAIFILFQRVSVYANDSSHPNNKFGIHLAQSHLNEINKIAKLVNGNGGNWGYVTVVIQENDRNQQKWQEIFDLLREFHLIPIVRLATKPEGESWRRPAKEEAVSWAEFLNSLNWVVKNRYIILFNEPNHGLEWGSEVDAKNYADVALEFAQKLKEKSPDFFIMLAGLDASAPSSPPVFEDEEIFLRTVIDSSTQILSHESLPHQNGALESEKFAFDSSIKNIFDLVDGLTSHSYPNPSFSGSPYDSGKGTIRTYQWELEILKELGVNKKLPVFITETGWKLGNENTVAENFRAAYENIWLPDNNIVAITPFVYDYQAPPFLDFSWKKFQSEEFYQQYYTVQAMAKTAGDPEQIDQGKIVIDFPSELVASSNYHFSLKLKNTGQAIWDKDENYKLQIVNDKTDEKTKTLEYFFSDIKKIKPFKEANIDLYIKTNGTIGKKSIKFALIKKDKAILETDSWLFEIVPLPSLEFKTTLFPKLSSNGDGFELQIFDEKEGIIFKRSGLRVNRGVGNIDNVQNIVLGKKYRVVLLKPYYLPRQTFISFKRGVNKTTFKQMFSLDFNQNGHIDWGDLTTLIQNPELIRLVFP